MLLENIPKREKLMMNWTFEWVVTYMMSVINDYFYYLTISKKEFPIAR